MVILILLLPDEPGTVMFPRVTVAQPVTDVGVLDGVEVDVIVGVNVIVGVFVGVFVKVLVGKGVLLGTGVLLGNGPGVDVLVGVGVLVGVFVAVGVFDGVGVTAAGVDVFAGSDPSSTNPRNVRALDEVKVRFPIGINLTMGL